MDARGSLEAGPLGAEPFAMAGSCPLTTDVGPAMVLSHGPPAVLFAPSGGPLDTSRDNKALLCGMPLFSPPLGLRCPGTRSPAGVCWICWSFGYLIFTVSRTYTRLNSLGSRGAELGSPARTTICLPYAVMLCPDRGDGAGPMFWKVYHLLDVMRKAARSPRSVPSSVLPPKMYMTSLTRAAE